jgi:hypothetical protein
MVDCIAGVDRWREAKFGATSEKDRRLARIENETLHLSGG